MSVGYPGISSKQTFPVGFLRKGRHSVHGPYFIHVIPCGSIFHTLIARSIVYFHKRRELTREGGLFAISKYDVDLLFAAHFYFPIRIYLDLVFATSHEI